MVRIVFSLFLMLLVFSVDAQHFNAGIKSGVTITQVDGDRYGGYDKVGFILGAYVYRELSNKTNFQLGMNYIGKGSQKNINAKMNDFTTYKMVLKYVEVPVTFQYEIKSDIKLELGLSGGVLISSKEYDEYGEIGDQQVFNNFEYSFVGGVEYKFSELFSVNANCIYTIFLHPIYTFSSNEKQYNNVLALTLKYNFDN